MGAVRSLLGALLLGLLMPTGASGALVFDFENGLQGWRAGGAATRVQTQVLGGSYAIFGDGRLFPTDFDHLEIVACTGFDLESGACGEGREEGTGIVFTAETSQLNVLALDFYYAGSLELASPVDFLAVRTIKLRRNRGVPAFIEAPPRLTATQTGPRSGTVSFDISSLYPGDAVVIGWAACPGSAGLDCDTQPPDAAIGFIDNIMLLPEPSGVLLMVIVGIGGAVRRRR